MTDAEREKIPPGCDPTRWTQLGVTWRRAPGEAIEDFYAVPSAPSVPAPWRAYFVQGPDFQHQRAMTAPGDGPLGPWRDPESIGLQSTPHQRLYRGGMGEDGVLISCVWPDAGKIGLWRFQEFGADPLLIKTLVLEAQPPFTVAACNPAVLHVRGGSYLVIFEGRAERVEWTLYAFHLHTGDLQQPVQPGDVHTLWPGANPSLVRVGSEVYLFYSDREFNVRVAKMEGNL